MDSGSWIKQLLEERFVKASDVEHLSRSIADAKANSDYYVSHATLADIAAGSIPSIYKIFSLAVCLKLPYEQLLQVFGIDPKEAAAYGVAGESPRTEMQAVDPRYLKFAPDVGQLQKAGADAAQVIKDFLPIVAHMHLKADDRMGEREDAGHDADIPAEIGGERIWRSAQDVQRADDERQREEK